MPGSAATRHTLPVLGTAIDVLGMADAVKRVAALASAQRGGMVCFCNAHALVSARQDPMLARALQQADLAAPDGAPVAWMLRRLGAIGQARVSGPDFMLAYCEHAAATGEPIYLYGSTPDTLRELQARLRARWPGLRIAGAHAPPFRPLDAAEQAADLQRIRDSGARTVWVGLGCPKQELWMAAQRPRMTAVLIGVGAAFDFHAGTLRRAPTWMQHSGLEWLHRLLSEPRRLGPRYLVTNTLFLVGAARQLLGR